MGKVYEVLAMRVEQTPTGTRTGETMVIAELPRGLSVKRAQATGKLLATVKQMRYMGIRPRKYVPPSSEELHKRYMEFLTAE